MPDRFTLPLSPSVLPSPSLSLLTHRDTHKASEKILAQKKKEGRTADTIVAYNSEFRVYRLSLQDEIERFQREERRASIKCTTVGERAVCYWRVFPRQAQAFERMDFADADFEFAMHPELEEVISETKGVITPPVSCRKCKGCHALKIFSFETRETGRRQFAAATIQGFLDRVKATPMKDRHFYELIGEGTMVRLYFDLEFKFADNPGRSQNSGAGEDMVEILIQAANAKIQQDFGSIVERSNWVELDSSTDSKFSRHLVLHLPNNALFKDNIDVGWWVQELVDTFGPPPVERTETWSTVSRVSLQQDVKELPRPPSSMIDPKSMSPEAKPYSYSGRTKDDSPLASTLMHTEGSMERSERHDTRRGKNGLCDRTEAACRDKTGLLWIKNEKGRMAGMNYFKKRKKRKRYVFYCRLSPLNVSSLCPFQGNTSCFIDMGVYTRNRAFRTYLSSKSGKQARLLLNIYPDERMVDLSAHVSI
jgi:hypothetical protein